MTAVPPPTQKTTEAGRAHALTQQLLKDPAFSDSSLNPCPAAVGKKVSLDFCSSLLILGSGQPSTVGCKLISICFDERVWRRLQASTPPARCSISPSTLTIGLPFPIQMLLPACQVRQLPRWVQPYVTSGNMHENAGGSFRFSSPATTGGGSGRRRPQTAAQHGQIVPKSCTSA